MKFYWWQAVTLSLLTVMATSDGNVQELRRYFDQSGYSGVFVKHNIKETDLETTARDVYMEFLKVTSLAQKNRLQDYFKEWELVLNLKGPFTVKGQDETMNSIINLSTFKAQLVISDLLENRDNSLEAKAEFKKDMITTTTTNIQVYFTGDQDIITGLVILSLDKDGTSTFITMITD